jgi:hypothetical protein
MGHQDRYLEPVLKTFSHVFRDSDARDEASLDDAAATLVQPSCNFGRLANQARKRWVQAIALCY